MKYPILERIYSFQDSGKYSGRAATIFKFAGCNLDCKFCDIEKRKNVLNYSILDFILFADKGSNKNIIFTGGEPTIHRIDGLIEALISCGFNIQIETNGTGEILARRIGFMSEKIYISASPKYENEWKFIYADELKYTVTENFYSDVIPDDFKGPIYLEPVYRNKRSMERVIELIRYNPRWRISIPYKRLLMSR